MLAGVNAGQMFDKGPVREKQHQLQPHRAAGVPCRQRPGLAGKPLFLRRSERQVGTGAAGAAFDLYQGKDGAFGKQKVSLRQRPQRPRGRAVAFEQEGGEGEELGHLALAVRVHRAPPGGALAPGRGGR